MTPKKPEGKRQKTKMPKSAELNRRRLMSISQDELIDIILELKDKLPLGTAEIGHSVAPFHFSPEIGAVFVDYVRLPAAPVRERNDEAETTWRLGLVSSDPDAKPLGLDIYDDVIVGRETQDITPDLDLTEYDAEERGVSRRHALLRPTKNSLFLIDLGSTNGTLRNGLRLSTGVAVKLKKDDIISFGRLDFVAKIVSQPEKPAT